MFNLRSTSPVTNWFIYAISCFLLLGLGGCGTKPYKEVKIEQTKVEKVTVPKEMTELCQAEAPVTKERYLALKPHEREEELTRYSVSLLGTIKQCNLKLEKIRKFSDEQVK